VTLFNIIVAVVVAAPVYVILTPLVSSVGLMVSEPPAPISSTIYPELELLEDSELEEDSEELLEDSEELEELLIRVELLEDTELEELELGKYVMRSFSPPIWYLP
jgi:hypothetical protein